MKNKIIQITLIFFTMTTLINAQYENIFFITENSQRMVSLLPMDRIICSTDNTESNIDYTKAEYEINPLTYKDQIVNIFNFDIVEMYEDEYMYDYPDPEVEATGQECYKGEASETYFGITQDGPEFSRNCYKESFIRTIKGKEVLCLKAEVMKRFLMIPKELSRVEQLVKDHCPSAVDPATEVIDEQKALDCVENLDYGQLAGDLNQ